MKITFEFDKDDVAHAGRIAQAALSNIGGVINTLLEMGVIDKTKLSEALSTGGAGFVHTQTQAGYPPPSAAPFDNEDPMLRKVRAVNLLLRLFPGTMKKPEFDLFNQVSGEVFDQIDALSQNPLAFRKFQWDKRDVLDQIQAKFPSVESFVEALEYPYPPLIQGPKLVSFLKACLDYTVIQPEADRSAVPPLGALTPMGQRVKDANEIFESLFPELYQKNGRRFTDRLPVSFYEDVIGQLLRYPTILEEFCRKNAETLKKATALFLSVDAFVASLFAPFSAKDPHLSDLVTVLSTCFAYAGGTGEVASVLTSEGALDAVNKILGIAPGILAPYRIVMGQIYLQLRYVQENAREVAMKNRDLITRIKQTYPSTSAFLCAALGGDFNNLQFPLNDVFSWNETSWRGGPHPAHRILNPAPAIPPTITPLATDDVLSQSTVFQGSFWSGAGAGASGVAVGEGVLGGAQEYQEDGAEAPEAPTSDRQQEAYRLLLALCQMPEGTHPAHVVGRLVDEEPLRPPLDMRLVAPLVNYQNSTFRKTYASLEEFLNIALGGMNITDLHYALFKLASLVRVMLQNFHSFNVEDVRRGEDRLDTYATRGDSQVAAGILVFSEKRAAEERPMLIEGQSAWVELLAEWVKGYGQEGADQPDRMKLLNSVMANFNRQIRLYLCYVGGLTHACRDAFSLIYANQGASRLILTSEQRAFAREVAENINTICSLRFQQFCVFLEKDKAEAYLPGKDYTAA